MEELHVPDIFDDFDVESISTDENVVEKAVQKLKTFVNYLVQNFEVNLEFCLKILEEKELPQKTNSIHVTAVSLLASVVPSLGKGISAAIKQGEIFALNKIDKKNSRTLADLIYFYMDNKEEFRQLLIEAAVEIFWCFEIQFRKLTCDGGPKRAMHKLAKDASNRIFNYLLKQEDLKAVTKDDFSRGVIFGDSFRSSTGSRPGRTVLNDESKWKSSKLYKKVGIFLPQNEKFYRSKETNTKKYGHRKIFSWENIEDIVSNWQEDEDGYQIPEYVINKSDTNMLTDIKKYIMSKTLREEAKLEREIYHNESVEDRKKNHDETITILTTRFNQLVDDLENFSKLRLEEHNESKELMIDIKTKQEEDLLMQQEISSKLIEIHKDVIETKENQIVLVQTHENIQNELTVIGDKQKDLEEAVVAVNVDQIKVVVKECSQDTTKDALKDLAKEEMKKIEHTVKEVLHKNDPGPAIHREADRFVKKIKFKKW